MSREVFRDNHGNIRNSLTFKGVISGFVQSEKNAVNDLDIGSSSSY